MLTTNLNDIQVSVIIPTYNRFSSLMQAIASVKRQSHKNIEIIVVNDASTDERYYNHQRDEVVWIESRRNTEQMFGFPCPGYVRNLGMAKARGSYIAFLDDDDLWLPEKTAKQLTVMEMYGYEISCTEGLMGDSFYDENRTYPLYNAGYYGPYYKDFLKQNFGITDGVLPERLDLELIRKHNCLITSSVMIKRTLLEKVGGHKELPIGQEDWDLWERCLVYSECVYLKEPLIYYDGRITADKQISTKIIKRFTRYKKQLLKYVKDAILVESGNASR